MLLFSDKCECCACGACLNICMQGAIVLERDENAFLYPKIDDRKCIECGMCENVCDFKKPVTKVQNSAQCYFAVLRNKGILMKSTSGGVFSALAEYILDNDGVVFGCTMKKNGNDFEVKHIGIVDFAGLEELRGSKYIQSNTGDTFNKVQEFLNYGRKVLFSGTPCQVAGLKSFLHREYKELYTVDLVCHGTPSLKMFNDFIHFLERKRKKSIIYMDFRKKVKDVDSMVYFTTATTTFKGRYSDFCKTLSYYGYFLDGDIYRESCYQCKYAGPNRVGDITLGDGWGVEQDMPQIFTINGGPVDKKSGISSMMVNTDHGKMLLEMIQDKVDMFPTTFNGISAHNHQLVEPTKKNDTYDDLFQAYRENGYEAVDQRYFRELGIKKYLHYKYYIKLRIMISDDLERSIRKMIRR